MRAAFSLLAPSRRSASYCFSSLICALGMVTSTQLETVDDLLAESLEVIRLAARDEYAGTGLVDVYLFVHPRPARVADVGLQARPARQRSPLDDAGFHQRPRAVADHRNRLARLSEGLREANCRRDRAQLVRVGHTAGEHQAVVRRHIRAVDRFVHVERVSLVEVVERLHLAVFGSDELRRAARSLYGLPRLGQLDLLDALGSDQERDRLAFEFISHTESVAAERVTKRPQAIGRSVGRIGAGSWVSPMR